MFKRKYGIQFPEIQVVQPLVPVSEFSERAIQETEDTFLKTFDLLHGLTNYVIQKNRTQELGKQLEAQRESLNAQVEHGIEQERLTFESYTRRLQIRLQSEKEQMELDIKRFARETSQKVKDFSMTVEEAIRENQLWMRMIERQQNFLISIQPYITQLETDYAHRREYIQYCDMQRKAFNYIDGYLKKMI